MAIADVAKGMRARWKEWDGIFRRLSELTMRAIVRPVDSEDERIWEETAQWHGGNLMAALKSVYGDKL